MAGPRGYSSYRGKKPVGKILLSILLVLIILGAVGFMLMEKYLVYDDSGKPHLVLPQTQEPESGSAGIDSGSDVPPISIQEAEEPMRKALLLSGDPAVWQSQVNSLAREGYNAFAVTVKRTGGRLSYVSAVQDAAPASDAVSAQTLTALCQGEAYAIARLSCFRDRGYANAWLEQAGLKNTGGFIFYDGNSENWLDPGKQGTRQYLYAIALECAQMGFDQILLTDFTYPTIGKLDKIDYGPAEQTENLRAFLEGMRAALDAAGYQDIKLAVELPESVIMAGRDDNAGLVLDEIAAQADIYAVTTPQQASALAEKVTAASEQAMFIPELDAPMGKSYLVMPAE